MNMFQTECTESGDLTDPVVDDTPADLPDPADPPYPNPDLVVGVDGVQIYSDCVPN
jgi:hypothetical protein